MIWSSEGITEASTNFLQIASNLQTIFDSIEAQMGVVSNNYEGPGSEKAKEVFAVAKHNLNDFILNIKECANYLTGTILPDLEANEKKIASTMDSFTAGE